jgi:NAD+---dinitrogen-reductase ADP-D-ribosyltransferase
LTYNKIFNQFGSNLVGIPAFYIASISFNENSEPMHISGTREAAPGLFDSLNKISTLKESGGFFQDYMCVVFGFEEEQRLRNDRFGGRRFRNSYLRLIQDWGIDSNNAQGAVFKGWVESRFGLYPNYHKTKLNQFFNSAWMHYIEEKMNSRYHNNCIYMQLDLLYEFSQWVIKRFKQPAASHKTLYRGIYTLDEEQVIRNSNQQIKIIRFNNIVSFTDQYEIASEFGYHVLQVEVPMSKLIFFNDLLPHHALHGEAEYLVIGGNYRVKILS